MITSKDVRAIELVDDELFPCFLCRDFNVLVRFDTRINFDDFFFLFAIKCYINKWI